MLCRSFIKQPVITLTRISSPMDMLGLEPRFAQTIVREATEVSFAVSSLTRFCGGLNTCKNGSLADAVLSLHKRVSRGIKITAKITAAKAVLVLPSNITRAQFSSRNDASPSADEDRRFAFPIVDNLQCPRIFTSHRSARFLKRTVTPCCGMHR